MKEIDINQLISAYYDNELTENELELLLEETKRDPDLFLFPPIKALTHFRSTHCHNKPISIGLYQSLSFTSSLK